jgi:hypothetical protein
MQLMERAYPSDNSSWSDSPQLTHLIALADPATHESTNNNYIDFDSGDYTKIQNDKLAMPKVEVAGQALERKEPEEVKATTSPSFAKGRLAQLITDEVKSTPWFKMHYSEIEAHEEAVQAQQEQAKLDAMPDDVREIVELKLLFERTEVQARKNLHKEVVVLCDKALDKQISREALLALIELIDDEIVDFQNVGKKRIKDRKRLINSVKGLI